MKFDLGSFVNYINMETDRYNLMSSVGSTGFIENIKCCPVTMNCKTVFCSVDAFYMACIGVGNRKKTVGNGKTNTRIELPGFCKKCGQLKASKKGKLVIDLAEYGIEIDENLMEKYMEGR